MGSTYDAIIIGAGAIGLGIGWRASQLGLSVLVVDRAAAGRGASWVAAGMLAPITEANFGEDDLLRLNLESARRYPGFLDELSDASGRPVATTTRGTLSVALDRDQMEALDRLWAFRRSMGLPVERLGGSACRALEPALHPSVRGGVLAAADQAVDPRDLTAALVGAVETSGGEVRTGAEVVEVLLSDGRVAGVRTANEERISSPLVVLAAGCWSGQVRGVPERIARSIRPVKGQVLRLRSRGPYRTPIEHIVRSEEVYLVPRSSGEVVVGATEEEQGFDTSLTAGGVLELLRAANECVPGIRELELAEAAAGLRPGSPDNAPLLGRCSVEGLVLACGHHRNGILLAPVTADAIAQLLVKGEAPPEIAPFDPERFAKR